VLHAAGHYFLAMVLGFPRASSTDLDGSNFTQTCHVLFAILVFANLHENLLGSCTVSYASGRAQKYRAAGGSLSKCRLFFLEVPLAPSLVGAIHPGPHVIPMPVAA